jgi:PAS domain S-box-containing protein
MFMSKLFSLHTKTEIFICLFSMGLMVCIWIFGYAFLAHEKQITLAAARQANANRAQILEHQTQSVLKEIDDYLLLVKQDYETSSKLSPATLSLTERLLSRVEVKQIGIADRQGTLALFGRPGAKVNIASEELFQSQKQQNSVLLHIGKPHLGLLPDQHHLYLSMRLNDREGDFAGIASVAVSMENFFAIPSGSDQQPHDGIVILGLDGIVRTSVNFPAMLPGEAHDQDPLLTAVQHNQVGELTSRDSQGRLYYRAFRLIPGYPLIISTEISEPAALKVFYERKRYFVLLGVLFFLIILLFAGYLVRTIRNRVRAETAAEEISNRYRTLLHDIQDGVIQTDLSGKILMVNEAVSQTFGYQAPGELIGKDIAAFWPDADSRAELRQKVSLQEHINDFPLSIRDRQGQTQEFSVNASIRRDSMGRMDGLVAVCRNVTEQRRIEREKKDLLIKAASIERISSLGIMVASVAHEISQPLQAGKLAVESVLYWQTQGKELSRKNQLDNVHRAADAFQRINRIVQHLRDFVRPPEQGSAPSPTVNQAVLSALDLMQARLKDHAINVHLDLQADMPTPGGNLSRLDEAVINVLHNALQALESTTNPDRTILISTLTVQNDLILKIENNGPLLDTAVAAKAFEPFFTTKARTEGMGLGLHIVRNITQLAGGNVEIANSDHGVKVEFRFPGMKPVPAAKNKESSHANSIS